MYILSLSIYRSLSIDLSIISMYITDTREVGKGGKEQKKL